MNQELLDTVKNSITNQLEKITALGNLRRSEYVRSPFYDNFIKTGRKNDFHQKYYQWLSDFMLNSMSSVIDYFYIYSMILLECPDNLLTRVQYKTLTSQDILDYYKKIDNSITKREDIFSFNDNECKSEYNIEYNKLEVHERRCYYYYYPVKFICKPLDINIDSKKIFKNEYDELRGNNFIQKYISLFSDFFCNNLDYSGVRFKIYIELNNYLKHNTIPIITPSIHGIKKENYIFSFFEIKNSHRVFLKKNSFIYEMMTIDFEYLKDELDSHGTSPSLNNLLGIDNLIKVDKINGHYNDDTLIFFIDSILIHKKKDSILIDAACSFEKTISRLIKTINRNINYTDL